MNLCLAAQPSVPMWDFGTLPFTSLGSDGHSIVQSKRDLVMGMQTHGWQLLKDEPGLMTLRLDKNNCHLDVLIAYTADSFKISYLDSDNLGYKTLDGGGVLIHPSYNRWIKNLVNAISPVANAQKDGLMASRELAKSLASDSTLVIHYHRNSFDYNGWGLHVWGDVFESPTSWFKPLIPSGNDGFGVYFIAKLNSPSSIQEGAQAFYIIHNSDKKDQCAGDMEVDYKKSHEIFVVSGDCGIYYSLADALKSKYIR